MATDPAKPAWKHGRPFRLGELEVLPASGELRGPGGRERLRPLLMDILLRLAAEPGEVVKRETLLEDVWPRRMVNDEVLSRAIAELRTALGDDARVARYIETLPKLGYRLVAKVEPGAPDGAPAQPRAAAPAWRRRAALGAIAATALAIAWWIARPQEPPVAEVSGLARKLVSARPFTSDPGLELTPRFSPDGSRVAFALAEGGESRIVVQSVDGVQREFIGGRAGVTRLSPVFLSDGRRVAYWKGDGADCAIVEHDLATTLERSLLDCELAPRSRFDISPDGRWLVFSGGARRQHPAALWVMEIDRGKPVSLTAPEPGSGDDLYPRFSPDGTRIAFYRGSESHRAPWVVTRGEPASARAAAKFEGLSYGLAWLGPGGPLLAAADWFGFRALNTVDIARGEALLVGARGARFPDVGPRGEIVYENAVYSANLWRLGTASVAEPVVLWNSTRYTGQAEFSPNGTRVVFASNRDGSDAIYVAPLDGAPKRVAGDAQFRYLRPHWSSDGRSILATRAPASGAPGQEAVRVPADGGTPQVLAGPGREVIDVREGGDGRLYWGELSGYAMRLMRAPLAGGAPERLALPLVAQYQIGSGRIAFVQPQLAALTVCRLETLACEPSGLEIAPDDTYHWALGPRSVFARAHAQGTPKLVRYDLAARTVSRSWDFAPGGAGTSIAVSPDEKTLLVAREEGPAIDLMIAR